MRQDSDGSLLDGNVVPETHNRLLPELDASEQAQQEDEMMREGSASFKPFGRTCNFARNLGLCSHRCKRTRTS